MRQLPDNSHARGRSAALTLLAVVFLALVSFAGWLLWSKPERPAIVAPTTAQQGDAPAEGLPDPVEALPKIEATVKTDSTFQDALDQAAKTRVRAAGGVVSELRPIHQLNGRVLNDGDDAPVYYFQVWMIPEEMGDPQKAKGTLSPNHMRNGRLFLDHQIAGVYQMIVESREHEPVTKKIEIPYEGELVVRLPHGTCIRGVVRDSFQTPMPNIEIQLQVDAARIDNGAPLPMQRMVKTNEQGVYAFWKLPPGEYGVRAELYGDRLAEEGVFRLEAGAEVVRDFVVERLGSLRVVVTNPIEQPITGARTTLYTRLDDGRDRLVRNVTSDRKGYARLEFVREGSYKLKVSVNGYQPHEETIVVAAGESLRDIPVRLELAPRPGG
jgi:hypothetical protein